MSHIHLDRKDRLILTNQFRLLAIPDPHEKECYNAAARVLERGFEGEYGEIVSRIHDGHEIVTQEECQFVQDVLQMYRRLKNGYAALDDKDGIDANQLEFPGFDGNNETKYLSYAQYLTDRNYWSESPARNSHSITLEIYRRMLDAFNQIMDGRPDEPHELDKEEIQRVLAERIRPEYREPVSP